MASAYSIIHKYADPQSNFDFELMGKVLSFKQQKFDANLAKIDAVYSKLENIDLAKGEDKEYFRERINNLTNELNSASQSGGLDLSNNSLVRNINTHIDQVFDNKVINGMINTKKLRAYQQSVEAIKAKNPDLYHQTNEAFGLSPAIDWMNDKTVGSSIKGDMYYEPYKDIPAALQKAGLDFQKAYKGQTIQMPDGKGNMITRKVESLTPQEIEQIGYATLGDKYNAQLRINAWGRFGAYKDPDVVLKSMANYVDKKVQGNEATIATLELQKTQDGMTKVKKAVIDKQIAALEETNTDLKKNAPDALKNPEMAGVFLEKEFAVNSLVSSMQGLYKESVTVSKDDNFWAWKDYNFKVTQASIDNSLKAAEFKYKKEHDAKVLDLEKQKLAATQASAATSDNMTALPSKEELGVEDMMKMRDAETATAKETFVGTTEEMIKDLKTLQKNGTPQEKKDATALITAYGMKLSDEYRDSKSPTKSQDAFMAVVTDEKYKNLAIMKNDLFMSGVEGKIGQSNIAIAQKEQLIFKQNVAQEHAAQKDYLDNLYEKYIDSPKAQLAFVRNKGVKTMIDGPDGKPMMVSIGQFIEDKGIMKGGYRNRTRYKHMNDVEVSINGEKMGFGDAVVYGHKLNAAINSMGYQSGVDKEAKTKNMSPQNIWYQKKIGIRPSPDNERVQELAEFLGENPEDVFEEVKGEVNVITGEQGTYKRLKKDSKTYKTMAQGVALGLYDKIGRKDNDLSDDEDINNYQQLSTKKRMRGEIVKHIYTRPTEYTKAITEQYNTTPTKKDIVVAADTPTGESLARVLNHEGIADNKTGYTVQMDPTTRQATIYQARKVGIGGDPQKSELISLGFEVLNDPMNKSLNILTQLFDMEKKKDNFSAAKMQGAVESGNLAVNNSMNSYRGQAHFLENHGFGGDVPYLTPDGGRDLLSHRAMGLAALDEYRKLTTPKEKQSEIVTAAETIKMVYDMIDQFSVSTLAHKDKFGSYVTNTVSFQGKPVFTMRKNQESADKEVDLVLNTPQVFLGQLLEDKIAKQVIRFNGSYNYESDWIDFGQTLKKASVEKAAAEKALELQQPQQ